MVIFKRIITIHEKFRDNVLYYDISNIDFHLFWNDY